MNDVLRELQVTVDVALAESEMDGQRINVRREVQRELGIDIDDYGIVY